MQSPTSSRRRRALHDGAVADVSGEPGNSQGPVERDVFRRAGHADVPAAPVAGAVANLVTAEAHAPRGAVADVSGSPGTVRALSSAATSFAARAMRMAKEASSPVQSPTSSRRRRMPCTRRGCRRERGAREVSGPCRARRHLSPRGPCRCAGRSCRRCSRQPRHGGGACPARRRGCRRGGEPGSFRALSRAARLAARNPAFDVLRRWRMCSLTVSMRSISRTPDIARWRDGSGRSGRWMR